MSYAEIATAAVSLLLIPLALYAARYVWERRRWKVFTDEITRVAREEFGCELMTRDDLRAMVAVKLADAGFEPSRVLALLPLAVDHAAGIISYELTGRYAGTGEKDDSNE